jgi:hypothetical protein
MTPVCCPYSEPPTGENRQYHQYASLDQDSLMDVDSQHIHSPSESDPRNMLQALWDAETRKCGAARVTIVNEIDNEPVPSSIDLIKFRYCELDYPRYVNDPHSLVYRLTPNLNSADSHIEALVGCDCQGTCTNPLCCHCQRAADTTFIGIEDGAAKFAYENVSPITLEVQFVHKFRRGCSRSSLRRDTRSWSAMW